MFYHTLVSDWNHGNAHFLRGIASELLDRGHEVRVFEPRDSWSVKNLLQEHGVSPIREFHRAYPQLRSRRYRVSHFDLERELDTADAVIVHEWNDPALVKRVGAHRRAHGQYALFFHDTHHRMVTDPDSMSAYHLENYDGVLAYGRVLRELYLERGNVRQAWTWHEAADTRIFRPMPDLAPEQDLVWIGNWGDDERTAELHTFLIDPVGRLKLEARVHGVRYPRQARESLVAAGISYAGWLPNFSVPRVFAASRMTVHVPRRPYVEALPGIPTIRPFEALACAIPLVCSPWDDVEQLFKPGRDYLVARNGREMCDLLYSIKTDPKLAKSLTQHGLETILSRHTCAHRVDELLEIIRDVRKTPSAERPMKAEPAGTLVL